MSLGIHLACPTCGDRIFDRNPTYNLGPMWRAAGIDWDALEGKDGNVVGPAIEAAIATLRAEPEKFRAMEPANRWGTYEGLLEVLELLVEACRNHGAHVLGLSR